MAAAAEGSPAGAAAGGGSDAGGRRRRERGGSGSGGSSSGSRGGVKDAVVPGAAENVRDVYKFGRVVGEGAFSVVYSASHRETGAKVAIKRIKKRMVKRELLVREVDIMTRANHPSVLNCFEVYETRDALFLVLPLLHGGELYDAVVDYGEYNELEAGVILIQLISAVEFLHSIGIAHRDLKPENILLAESHINAEGEDTRDKRFEKILLADFGLSKVFAEGDDLKSACGSPTYVAPEVLLCRPYDAQVDLWAVGVIAFVLLTGCFPFFEADSNFTKLYQKIITVEYTFPTEPQLSDQAQDFIRSLLVRDPAKRLTPEQCYAHPFLAAVQDVLPTDIADSLRKHHEMMATARAAGTAAPNTAVAPLPAGAAEAAHAAVAAAPAATAAAAAAGEVATGDTA